MSPALTGTVAVVSGASSGIGDATVRLLAEHGATGAVVARRKDRLDTLASANHARRWHSLAVAADLTEAQRRSRPTS